MDEARVTKTMQEQRSMAKGMVKEARKMRKRATKMRQAFRKSA